MKKIPVGILGATGMVGQRFVTLLENHPWFEVVILAASPRSAGKSYAEAVADRWRLPTPTPAYAKRMHVYSVEADLPEIAKQVRLVFSALEMEKDAIKSLEMAYASHGVAVVSNNSAHRWTGDVPMIMPEINPEHTDLIYEQRKRRGFDTGFVVVKPNCSLQSYIPVIYALRKFSPTTIEVTTLQAISGAGKTFVSWPEMVDNCIPYIGGEEEKTEQEPLKILGTVKNASLVLAKRPRISATCIRVAVADGHMASVAVKFVKKPTLQEIIASLTGYNNPIEQYGLPSAPKEFLHYFTEENRPQTNLDRDLGRGMAISCGRFREDPLVGWKFVSLSHNTIRGAAGGAVLTAELLKAKGFV